MAVNKLTPQTETERMTRRICLALDLKDNPALIAEYERYHLAENAWPEIVDSIAGAGIAEMEIYRTGNRLFMVMEVSDDFDPQSKAAADASNPKVAEWEALMERFQQFLPWAEEGEKWVAMDRIYSLDEAKDHIAGRD